jgi:short-subunit dehydrogenase involved in D-alanine esterification of teichoic acids
VEIMPPAVQTELHTQQADLVAAGDANFGVPLKAFADETWSLMRGDENLEEIMIAQMKENFGDVEDKKRRIFHDMGMRMKRNGKA